MYTRKSKGTKNVTCGTPDVTGFVDDKFPSSHGHILQHVDSTKYLDLNISKNLSWNTHVDAVTKKANNTLAFLRRNIVKLS
jgi:hypothetical protein